MSLLGLIVVVCLFVIGFWANNTYAPTSPPVRMIINIVLVVMLVVIILGVVGFLPSGDVRIR